MNIKEQHYDFKQKLNKIDSQKYRNLQVPEIDWKLNEARELFVKMVAEPRRYSHLGFETNQRVIDDIRNLVVHDPMVPAIDNVLPLPYGYWFHLRMKPTVSSDTCPAIKFNKNVTIRQHDDDYADSPFDRSDYKWRTINGVFNEQGIVLADDNTSLKVHHVEFAYIRKLTWVHNAEDHIGGSYKLPGGQSLTGTQDDTELTAHREIVDIAVRIAMGEIESQLGQRYSTEKMNMNHLI